MKLKEELAYMQHTLTVSARDRERVMLAMQAHLLLLGGLVEHRCALPCGLNGMGKAKKKLLEPIATTHHRITNSQ